MKPETSKSMMPEKSGSNVSPGEFLSRALTHRGMTQKELALRMGRPVQAISEIVNGKKRITHETGLELERVLDIRAEVWADIETRFTLAKIRADDRRDLEDMADWVSHFPISEMKKRGWISADSKDEGIAGDLLRYFKVANLPAWRQYCDVMMGSSFRFSGAESTTIESLSSWLTMGVQLAEDKLTEPYDSTKFMDVLGQAKKIMYSGSPNFYPRLQELFSSAGVVLLLVPELKNSGAAGVARWISPERALIQLSLRFNWSDMFWFSLFHEAGHVLSRNQGRLFVDIDLLNNTDEEEASANRFARNFLIDFDSWTGFTGKKPFTEARIKRLASENSVLEGTVVGRLMHEDLVPFRSQLRKYRTKYKWLDKRLGHESFELV